MKSCKNCQRSRSLGGSMTDLCRGTKVFYNYRCNFIWLWRRTQRHTDIIYPIGQKIGKNQRREPELFSNIFLGYL